jgi:hypothetical protein
MTEKIVTLSIPEALFERIQKEANGAHQPFESVMLDGLKVLFNRIDEATDVDKALDALDTFKDYELWAIVSRRLSATDTDRLHELGGEEKRSLLSTEEQNQLDQLLAQVNRDMLLRSKALMLLKERGHDITAYVKTGT